MNRFSLIRRATIAEARERIEADPEGRVFRAGGIDLLDHIKEGLTEPDELVELRAIAGDDGNQMRGVSPGAEGGWQIGALVTLGQIAGFEDLPSGFDALRQSAQAAATPGIRNAATVGGNLLQRPRCWYYRNRDMICLKKGGYECLALTGDHRYHAILGGGPSFIVHPSSLASALVTLDATVTIVGKKERRTIPVAELFSLPTVDPQREHTLGRGEVLLCVQLGPVLAGQRSAYVFAKEKQSHDWPLAEASVRCTIEGGRMQNVRVTLGHVAPIPWRSQPAEDALEGQAPSASLFENAAKIALGPAKPLDKNAYKIPLARGLLRQALHQACDIPLPETNTSP